MKDETKNQDGKASRSYTAPQVAEMLGVAQATVYRHLRAGLVGEGMRVSDAEMLELVRGGYMETVRKRRSEVRRAAREKRFEAYAEAA